MKTSTKNNILKVSMVLSFFSFGCSDALDEELQTSQSFEVAIAGFWTPSESALEASSNYHPEYHGAPVWAGSCPNTFFTDEAKDLKAHLLSRFSEISRVEGYSCRKNSSPRSNQMSVHGTGRALDLMIPTTDGTVDGPADNTAGDKVANYLVENAEELGIQYIIWDRWQYSPSQSGATRSRAYNNKGSDDHNNHIHVEVLPARACTGNIEIAMEWTAKTDLDIHVVPPGGREISPDIGDSRSSLGGNLERDSCYKSSCYDQEMDHREVVAWKNVRIPEGTYRVWAENFNGMAEAQFEIQFVFPNGDVRSFPASIAGTKGSASEVFEFELTESDLDCPGGASQGSGSNGQNGSGGQNGGGQNGDAGGDVEPPSLIDARVGCSSVNSVATHPLLFLLAGLFAFGRRKKKSANL